MSMLGANVPFSYAGPTTSTAPLSRPCWNLLKGGGPSKAFFVQNTICLYWNFRKIPAELHGEKKTSELTGSIIGPLECAKENAKRNEQQVYYVLYSLKTNQCQALVPRVCCKQSHNLASTVNLLMVPACLEVMGQLG